MNNCIRFFIVLTTLLFFSCNHNSDKSLDGAKNDSIKKYLDLAGNDTLSFKLRDQYNSKALSFVDLERNDTINLFFLEKISMNFFLINKLEDFKRINNILLTKSISINDTNKIATSYRYKDLYYMNKSVNDSAVYFCFKALKLFEKTKNLNKMSNIYCDLSLIQSYECDYYGSNKTAIKGLKIAKSARERKTLYIQISNNLASLKQYKKSQEYLFSALKIIEKDKSLNKFLVWNNIGTNYLELKEYNKAIYYSKKVVDNQIAKKKNPENYCYSLDQIAFCKLKKNDFSQLPKLFFDSEKIRDSNNIENGRNYNKVFLSEYYAILKDTLKAINKANEAIRLSKEYKNPGDLLLSLKQLIKLDKRNASKLALEYIKLEDSLQLAERNFKEKYALIEFETNEISQEKEKAIKQKWVLASIISSVLIIVILLFVIFKQKAKQKELQLLQDQQKANEEIYQLMFQQQSIEDEAKLAEKKRIALELHDNIMNKLASTRFNLFAISKKTDETTIKKAIEDIEKIKDIENEIRDITHELNKDVFEGIYSFTTLLEKLIAEQNQLHTTHFELELDANINWDKVSSKIKMHLYRILQESIHNINKHANASQVTINMLQDTNNLCVSVQDNGVGFDTTKTKDGIGITNIQQRLEQVNGKITLQSQENKGTTLFITVPIND